MSVQSEGGLVGLLADDGGGSLRHFEVSREWGVGSWEWGVVALVVVALVVLLW
jgi:hypothetical protein